MPAANSNVWNDHNSIYLQLVLSSSHHSRGSAKGFQNAGLGMHCTATILNGSGDVQE